MQNQLLPLMKEMQVMTSHMLRKLKKKPNSAAKQLTAKQSRAKKPIVDKPPVKQIQGYIYNCLYLLWDIDSELTTACSSTHAWYHLDKSNA